MVQKDQVYIAIDLGAGSGRVNAGVVKPNGELSLVVIHRFDTVSVEQEGHYYWDIKTIYQSILQGLEVAASKYQSAIRSIGVDAWGVDYAFLDASGELLGNPFQYRDPRTQGIPEKLFQKISKEVIFQQTGIQFMDFNTLYQLHAETRNQDSLIRRANRLLLIPDLIGYWLTGVMYAERTIASTTQFLNPITKNWAQPLLYGAGIPEKLLPKIIEPATIVGKIQKELQVSLHFPAAQVIAVGGHDTASAVAGVSSPSSGRVFLSSGTWSLMGIECSQPIINPESLQAGFSNEVGIEKTIRFLKNICGLWLIQQCKAEWDKENPLEFATMVRWAQAAKAVSIDSVIDPDNPIFALPGNMPNKIRNYCQKTGQTIPESKGSVLAVIFQSLAAKYRIVFDQLSHFSPVAINHFHIVGGGCKNEYLCQCTANVLEMTVKAGPTEASSLGNIITQMLARQEVDNLDQGRKWIANNFSVKTYLPDGNQKWRVLVNKLRVLLQEENECKFKF